MPKSTSQQRAVRSRKSKSIKTVTLRHSSKRRATLFTAMATEDSPITGVLYLSDDQASIDSTLVIEAGIDDFAQAVAGGAAEISNAGYSTGDRITVLGHRGVVHLDEHPISVIVMSNVSPK